MSASGDLLEAVRAACAVDGTTYDLSPEGLVQVGLFAMPMVDSAPAFVSVSEGDVTATTAVDLYRWTYRATVVLEGWAGADGDDQAARISAAQDLRSQLLAALHGVFVTARPAAVQTPSARDIQISTTVMAGEFVADAWQGWGYVQIQLSYTADGDPGAF